MATFFKFLIFFAPSLLVAAQNFVSPAEFIATAPSRDLFTLKAESLTKLWPKENGDIRIVLEGRVATGVRLLWKGYETPLTSDREFSIDLILPRNESPPIFSLDFKHYSKGVEVSKRIDFTYRWNKTSPFFKIRIKEEEEIIDKKASEDWDYESNAYLSFSWLEDSSSQKANPWHNHFVLSSTFVLPNYGGVSISPELGYAPIWKLSDDLTFRLFLSASIYRYNPSETIPVASVIPFLGYYTYPFLIELGAGMENWFTKGGFRLSLNEMTSYIFNAPVLGTIDRLYLGFTYLFAEGPHRINEIKAGIGFRF